jgi:hypothetical protein
MVSLGRRRIRWRALWHRIQPGIGRTPYGRSRPDHRRIPNVEGARSQDAFELVSQSVRNPVNCETCAVAVEGHRRRCVTGIAKSHDHWETPLLLGGGPIPGHFKAHALTKAKGGPTNLG